MAKKKTVIPKSFYRKEISRDLNYYAVKQKLKSFGIDLFNYVKPPKITKKVNKSSYLNKVWHLYKKFIYISIIVNCCSYQNWIRYCKAWNFYLNGAVRYGS